MADRLKAQLNDLVRYSRDLGPHSDRVTALIKQHNSLSLRASRECQNKERLLEQRFRAALRDFQQWLVNAKISTAKCFDIPQSVTEASSGLLRIQEFLNDREHGQARLSAVGTSGELLMAVVPKDREEGVKAKVANAREDWKSLMTNLQMRETALKNLQSQMRDFEISTEPLQDWLNSSEVIVQESSARLHDLPAKRQELSKLQCVLEELSCREAELGKLRERAHRLWEGQAAGKGFVHRVSQLSAQYLALSNLTKDKASRIERIVGEHRLFSQGLTELQNWVSEAERILNTCLSPTADKTVLEDRMIQLEALLAARQEREIQLKMLLTRGEAVQRNTSAEGVPVIRKQIQDLKDSWDSLLSASIQCKSQLEGSLSQWTSYQEDVGQFIMWMERVEATLGCSDRQYSEMRDKTANLGKTKLLYEEVLSHSSPLETIATKGSNMAEHYTTHQEVHSLQERYTAITDKAKAAVYKAKDLVLAHQEYQRGLHMFEDWLEQEQGTLGSLSHPEGDVDTLENTLQQIQLLQERCSQGQSLLSSLLSSRDGVIPWGAPQIEDRALDTAQREWGAYQARLGETRATLGSTLGRLRQMGQRFQSLALWLEDMEGKANIRGHRRSDSASKDTQLKQLQLWQEGVLARQSEVDGLSALAQQVLEETHISSRVSTRATQLTARYHALILNIQETIKQLKEELRSIEEAKKLCVSFSDWLRSAQKNFRTVTASTEALDRVAMERKMKKVETLQAELQQGHGLLKALRERAERAAGFLEEAGAEGLGGEVEARLAQLEELAGGLRQEHSTLERAVCLAKEFQDRYKAQAQWVVETRAMLSAPLEPKAELYQKRAQLAKYKALLQTVQSHDSAVRLVVEKGESLLLSVQYPSIRDNMNRLQMDYTELCNAATAHVQRLEGQVKEQEVYHVELQEVERWLLQMSSRMVTPDPTAGGGLEAATQQLASHKAIMEEIAGFEDRLAGLKERGDDLVEGCSERVQSRLRQQVQAQQQGTRDSYSAICSTAQRVYQSLDRELQRHVSLQDALQQCQTWLVSVSEEPEPTAHFPLSLEEALQQVKHERTLQEQASTYLQLVCSTCDLSEQRVRETAQDIQQVKLQIEERMLVCEEVAESWRDVQEQRADLEAQLRETEQQLQNLSRRPAELEPKITQNQLDQAQEFLQQLRVRQVDVTQLSEAVAGLTEGQASPALEEMRGLRRAWEELGQKAEELEGQRGEDMQRSGEYHDCVAAVEELFHQVSREWDYLARADTESTSEHLEALRKLCCDLEDQRGTLEELRDQRQAVLPRLSLLDKELVKQQVGHLEKRWSQLDSLIQGKIQDSSQTLEDLGRVEAQLREAREWMEEQRPALTSALKTSPPPDLAQSFLFDHLSVCVELEARGQLLGQAVSEAQRVAPRLGLSERRRLQELVLQAEGEVEALGARVSQRRKYLSKAFTERTQFLQAVGRALSWVQQQERKALMDDHVALLPDDLTKQVVTCRGVQSGLRAYQGELASLWAQGRDLERDATDQERGETVTRLEELQRVFETAFQRTTHRLQDLDRALTSRKYFKVDLDRTCHWLRRADGITFPEIDFTCNADDDSELQGRMARFQNVLEQASEYENLLLIVQRVGQEILPSLNEVDHCYLDEKLNALPQQYNSILALAKEKRDRIQQAILERKDYGCFFNVTCSALEELQEQLDGLAKRTVSIQQQDVVHLRDDHRDLSESLAQLSPAVRELRRKTEGFLSRGQRCHTEETEQLVNLHDNLKRTIDQRLKHLDDSLKTLAEYSATSAKLDSELKSVKEQFTRMKSDSDTKLCGTERLRSLYTLLEDLERMGAHLERLTQQTEDLGLNCDPAAIQASREVVTSHQKELQSVRSEVKGCVTECENCLKKDKEFEKEIGRTSDWLKSLRKKLGEPLTLPEVKVERVEEEVRRLKVVEEEVQSRLRVADAMCSREKQRYSSGNETCPAHVEANLEELAKLRADVQQALRTKQLSLDQTLSLVQRHHSTQQSAHQWLDEAGAFLQRTTLGIELENQTESLRELEEILAQEPAFMAKLEQLETLGAQLDGLVGLGVTKEMKESERKKEGVEVMQQKGSEVKEQLKGHREVLQSCAAQWSSFQTEREELIGQMNETGSMMSAFPSAKAANSQEAEDKLRSYKSLVILIDGCEPTLTGLKEKAADLALVGSEPSKAAIDHSVSSLWQRWTRLRSVARAQERALEDTARDWRSFREKMEKVRSVSVDLHARVPDSTVEKAATRAALQSLLEYHDSFSLEVEREQSTLALLGQHTLSLIGEDQEEEDMEMEKIDTTREETPCLKEIRSMLETYESLVLQVRGSRAQVQQELREREEVERELGLVKGWIQDTRGLLLSPSSDLDSLLHELETAHGEVISRRQSVERMVELQQSKYQDLQTALPSELSMQLAEVTLALGSAEDQVQSREREVQQTRDVKEDFSSRLQDIEGKLKTISLKISEKATGLEQAKEETKCLCEECEGCGRSLAELVVAVQEFGDQNPLLCKQLGDALSRLAEVQRFTTQQAQERANQLHKAEQQLEEYKGMRQFLLGWAEKAEALVTGNIIWSSASQLQEQIRAHQAVLRECRGLHGDLEAMGEREGQLGEVLQTEGWSQQVKQLSRCTEELQQSAKTRLQSLQDAAKDMVRLEAEVKILHDSLDQAQLTLTSPDLARLSLREQLTHRQRLLVEMEAFKQQVQAVQLCQSALRLPEEVVASLSICRTAQSLQQEASQLQHTTIQQCNILQEAVVQYEQYEQEVRNLQRLIEEAHRIIQDRPVSTSNIHELQAQIHHHEELALKIRGYQEQIASLNTKCKMLTVKAKHATMLLTVSEVEGLSDGMDELSDEELPTKQPPAHPSVVMMTAGRCHTLLSPVTEESGEEGTNSEVSSPACRSPSPGANADTPLNQARAPLSRAPLQELYDPSLESNANLDDLQRSWETLKNVISEKQKTLYEALERQQHYQESLQSISTKMESIEGVLNEGLESRKSPESQMAAHQALMDEILMLQDEIGDLQTCFSEELCDGLDSDSDPGDQLALHSTLTVLGERMATIRMKASGKRQLLEERLSEQLEEQRQEQALQRYHSEAEELDHWLLSTKATLSSALQPHPEDMDMEEQLIDCQNMLFEIEQKVASLSELSVHSESLLLEGRAGTRGEAEQLTFKLHSLKDSLVELQRMLQDKQVDIQGSLQEQEDSEPDSILSQSPNIQDWLSQARSTRTQQHHDNLLRQTELEEQLAEQRRLLKYVASVGEEILSQQTTPNGDSEGTPGVLLEAETLTPQDQMRQRWENLSKDQSTKLQLSLNSLEQEQLSPVLHRSCVSSPGVVFRREAVGQDPYFPRALLEGCSQTLERLAQEPGGVADNKQGVPRGVSVQEELYAAVSAASSWLDSAENNVLSGPVLLSEDTETQLSNLEGLSKEVREVTGEMSKCRELLGGGDGAAGGGRRLYGGEEQALMEDTLDGLQERLGLLDQTLEQHCDCMRDRLQEHTGFQTELRLLFTALSESKHQLLQRMAGAIDRPAPKQMETLSEVEDGLREFEQRVAELRSRAEGLQPDQISNQELLKLQDAYEELVLMVGSRRSSLNHSLSLKAQYESALHDLTNLVDTAQDKMAADQKMTVGSVIEVQMLLDKHKVFFQGLEGHMILTQTFYSKVSGLVVQRESQVLEETLALANNVLKQAHRRGVELEGILESWSMLVEDYQALCRQLEAVECSIPTVGLVEETEERLSDRITLYQRLKTSLTEHQPQLYQVMEEGKRLLLSVCCSDLENQLTQLGDHWLCSTTKVNKELHRFDSTLKHWSRYQSESAELSQWLRSALDRLEFWTTQSVTVPQELETVRDHLYAFLEFSKEVDAKSSLRSSVLSTGNQLLRLKRVDTAGLRSALAQVDTQWAELFTRIPVVQEKLHQLQMEKLASRHAITELMSWISLMENVIAEDQQRIMGAVGSEVVQDYLQKYKGFSIDLTCKQLTVDFVNQSVLQISSQDVEGKRSDKTDFAERLGAMNRRWQILQGLINEKIQLLEGLLEGWMEHENGVQALKTWLTLQEDKLKKRHRIDDVASVQNALKDCQELEELVKEKEKDLEKAEERGSGLIQEKRGQDCSVVMETLKGLNQSWANLDNMIGQMKVSLRSVLEQWTVYRRAAEEINGYLMEGRYSVSRLHLLTGSLEAVQQQVESLENLREELDKQESSLRKFGSVTHQLLTECHPSVADTLDGALRDVNIRWNGLLEQISEQLRSSKALLGLWQRYTELYDQSVSAVHRQEERADRLLKSATDRDITEEESSTWIRDCNELLGAQATVQQSLLQLQQLGEQLKTKVDASSMAALKSDCLSLTHRLATLEHALHRQQEVLQCGAEDCERFKEQLDSLTSQAEEAEEVLRESDPVGTPDLTVIQERMEKLKTQMCKLSSHSPDLERVNELAYRLPLNDREIKRLQSLNRAWTSHSAHLSERFSKLQAVLLQQQSFLQKCEDWMDFLSQTEQKLAAETSGNYHSLLEQQRDHELFQAEMFSRQQILYSIISDGHRLLDQGQVDDRDDFSLKLALLGNQWQGVVRRAQQRRGIIDSLVRQWQRYREMAEKLRRWLQEVSRDPEVHQQGEAVALQQARTMLDQIQLRERVLQRQQGGYILAVEAGRSLLLSADARAESALQTELMDMQECWRHANVRLDEQKRELLSLLKDWGRCEKGIAASLEKLRAFKRKLSLPLPENHEELHSEQVRCKELESNVDGWTDDLTSLFLLRDSLEGVVSADDLTVLQDRLQLLQRQWEEICHQLSLRRQQVSEKLNEWAVFNEKNKDLCEWLTQMESKVSQNGDISIKEMIEKLRKDYQEEIGVAQENKQQLQVMGERLARASHESKAAEIQHKLSKVSERWQHLLDLIAARVKKLRETLVAVQQLDKNMCSLRSWLAHIETELTRPLVYDTCDAEEIQRKLNQQQDIQRDIEKHSTGVASVLNLCEVLLHDCDACSTETECDSIQQATRGLDRRWRNICAMSMERRLKIEETWRLWQKFLEDFSRFEEWLKTSERTAALPNSSGVLYTIAKEELKKFEAFQRQVQEFLTQLELINKQYRRLARENRTDSSCRLREMVHDGNRRWDNLQKRVASILRRLKHFIGQREEFETARDSILVWLTEMDLQLTNIEHFSECDVQAKIKQLRAFQQEISLNTGQIELVFRQGEALIEKSEPLDGAVLEEELEELQRYWQEVFGRVDRYYKKLTRLPLADDELDCSDRELDMDESADLSDLQWGDSSLPCPSSRPTSGSVLPPQADRSGRDTPASMDSIPLEWDHDYDLSRGLESAGGRGLGSDRGRGQEQEEEYLRSAAAVLSDVVIPESPEAYIKLTESTLRSSSGEPGQLEAHLRQLDQAVDSGRYPVQQGEAAACSGQASTSPEMDSTYMGYMRLMGECRGSIDAVKRAGGQLTEEDDDMPGLTNPTSTDSQSAGVIERWELIQAQSLSDKHREKQNLQQCHQLISDLQTMRAWLGEAEAELGQLRVLDLSTDIHTIQQRIRKLKELQKAMDCHKSQVLSINLSSADFFRSEPDSEEAWELRDGLKEMNSRWDWLGSSLEDWRAELQRALMQCQEFHELSHGLLLWLENIDRRRNEVVPIPPRLDRETLRAHHRTLMQIKRELLDSQQKASSLQELSAQLLVHTQASEQAQNQAQGSEHLEAQEKVHVIGNRLRLLLREVSTDLEGLERRLETMDTQQDSLPLSPMDKSDISGSTSPISEGTSTSRRRSPRGKSSHAHPGPPESGPHHSSPSGAGCASSRSDSPLVPSSSSSSSYPPRGQSFILRVLRAALPLQLLLLLLIGLACLVPMTEEDYSCHHANNFARSFHPMLRYTNGPPPI